MFLSLFLTFCWLFSLISDIFWALSKIFLDCSQNCLLPVQNKILSGKFSQGFPILCFFLGVDLKRILECAQKNFGMIVRTAFFSQRNILAEKPIAEFYSYWRFSNLKRNLAFWAKNYQLDFSKLHFTCPEKHFGRKNHCKT